MSCGVFSKLMGAKASLMTAAVLDVLKISLLLSCKLSLSLDFSKCIAFMSDTIKGADSGVQKLIRNDYPDIRLHLPSSRFDQ